VRALINNRAKTFFFFAFGGVFLRNLCHFGGYSHLSAVGTLNEFEHLMSLLLLMCRICLQFTDLMAGVEYFVPENVTLPMIQERMKDKECL